MKKSRSSVPLLPARLEEGPAPPVRKEGLLATDGRPEPEPAALPAPCFVAIAVGKTQEGASFPANPMDHEYYFSGSGGGGWVYQVWRNQFRWDEASAKETGEWRH